MASWGAGSPSATIAVDLRGSQVRGAAPNQPTLMGRAQRSLPQRRRDLPELFELGYRAFADRCRAVDEPGVAVIAVHELSGRAEGIVTLRARVERHVAAIVGRHDSADLYLTQSAELALRHLAVIVDPVTSWKPGDSAAFRVLDLRTGSGFVDEQGRTLRGIRCEGPAMLRCADHALFLLPLGDPSDWPASAKDAWGFLPERVYFDELLRCPEGSFTRMPQRKEGSRKSMIFRTHGPRDSGVSLVTSGTIAGTLDVIGPNLAGQITIGSDELRDGVLLGRYARCDSAQYTDDPSMSRVHALMIQIGERVLLVDTASVNGTRLYGHHRSRVIELTGDTELQLGKATRARWRLA